MKVTNSYIGIPVDAEMIHSLFHFSVHFPFTVHRLGVEYLCIVLALAPLSFVTGC